MLFYECITHYYLGRQSEEQQKFGECLAYFSLANDELTACSKLAKVKLEQILLKGYYTDMTWQSRVLH